MVNIYTLSDSTGIRYVGKTNNIKRRLRNHINEANQKGKNNHRINWIKSLRKKNEIPTIEILDVVPEDSWVFWEIYWISQLKSWGFSLVNGTIGGEDPPSFKGKTHSDEYKKIRRELMLMNNPAKKMNDTWKNNISKSMANREFSAEHRKKLGKPIVQLLLNGDFIKKWDSSSFASESLGISQNSIRMCVRGERNKAGGYKWADYEKK